MGPGEPAMVKDKKHSQRVPEFAERWSLFLVCHDQYISQWLDWIHSGARDFSSELCHAFTGQVR